MTALLLFMLLTAMQALPAQAVRSATLLDDVAKFASAAANEERFGALTAMLSARTHDGENRSSEST